MTGGSKRWRDRKGERRNRGRGREQALPAEESAGVTGGECAGAMGEVDLGETGEPGRVVLPIISLACCGTWGIRWQSQVKCMSHWSR